MNPYDADTHPGPYLVVEVLGVGDVSVHALAHGPEEPLHQAATRVIEAAAVLDERHESVLDAVQRAQRLLEGTGRGEVGRAQVSYALLRTALPDLGDCLAQQDRAYSQLVESLSAYRRLLSSPPASTRQQQEPRAGPEDEAPPGRRLGRRRGARACSPRSGCGRRRSLSPQRDRRGPVHLAGEGPVAGPGGLPSDRAAAGLRRATASGHRRERVPARPAPLAHCAGGSRPA